MTKKKSYVPIVKLKTNLRKIHLHCKQRQKAKARTKIDAALFKCETPTCNIAIYEGASEKNLQKLVEKYPEYEVISGRIECNHLEAVVEPKRGFADWNTYIERLWCSAEDYSVICKSCHEKETEKHTKERVENNSLKRKK